MRSNLLYQFNLISYCFPPHSLYLTVDMPPQLLPQGLCTCYTHCVECSSPRYPPGLSLVPSSSLFRRHLFTHLKSFPILTTPPSLSSPLSCFIFPLDIDNAKMALCINARVAVHHVLLECKLHEGRGLCLLQRTRLMSWL